MAVRDPKARAVFWDIHSGLPREGPGNRESTERALDGPMEQRLKSLVTKYAGDPLASAIVRQSLGEIGNFRDYSAYYGYLFLVMATDGIADVG
jgi:hypothetical protein